MRERKTIAVLGCLLISVLIGGFTAASSQQDIKTSLFKEASEALNEARDANADLLAPKSFSKAFDYYRDAEEDFEKGKNLEDIRKKLNGCVNHVKIALEATKLSTVALSNSIKARTDAKEAGAPEFAQKLWLKADEIFNDAARESEDGDTKNAKKKSGEAETLFRQAELEAIKANYLKETWTLLKEADDRNVKKYAPKTLQKANELVTKAEKELNENRYDTDVALSLSRQAKYETKHALYLADRIKEIRDDEDMLEDYILSTEKPLNRIAETFDIVGSFDTGFDVTTDEIVSNITALQEKAASLEQDLSERDRQVTLLSSRISELEEKLGGIEKEKSELSKQIEAQAKIREKFMNLEKLFTKDQANVLRKGDDIIVRLIGLTFPVGKSIIEAENFELLAKLKEAIAMFPECTLTIEGHTDSHGGDQQNMKLSQARADAVSQYIQANMSVVGSRIQSVGFGESKPIANNETREGRAKNRRIDVIIHPKL
ncbi:MAG: OmpA family protein [candidate division KSB1 bacterium]|jgi:outer membrane protein OmpA-like peptidoglycan-associated protein|nr:OmpA family protein [candidate division KSB1 bacterium]